jgi:hypothetical protein
VLGPLKHPAYLNAVKFEHEGAGGSFRLTSKTASSALTTEMSAIAQARMKFNVLDVVDETLEVSSV